MTQVNNSNITFTSLKKILGITTTTVNFSDFRKLSTDTVKSGTYSLSLIANKYRVFIPTDLVDYTIIIWHDASNLITNTNNYKKFTNLNKIDNYGFNGKPCFVLSNNENKITNTIYTSTSFSFCFVLFSESSNISSLFTSNLDNTLFKILNGFYSSNNFNITKPCILIITINFMSSKALQIITRINGYSLNEYYVSNEIDTYDIANIKINNQSNFFSSFVGNISEILIFNKYLGDIKSIEYIESYLSSKWFGIPSYCLPIEHTFYNVAALNLENSPIILYNFSNNYNYGTYGNYYDLILNVNHQSKASVYYEIESLQPYIWFKFDNNIDNSGFTSNSISLIKNGADNIVYSDNYIKGNKSINLTNINCQINTFTGYISEDFTLLFWFCINGEISNSFQEISLFTIFNEINYYSSTTFKIKNNDYGSLILSINNLLIANNVFVYNSGQIFWQNIALSMKKQGSNTILNIYYNSILIHSNIIIQNFSFINSTTKYIKINENEKNILYDDFRIYNKALSTLEIQDILQYPISRQSGLLLPNTYGYKWSLNNFIENNILSVKNSLNISDNRLLTISFNLTIFFKSNFNIINILYISNYLDITLFYNPSNLKYSIKILNKNYNSDGSNIIFSYFLLNDLIFNKSNNYIIKINFNNSNEIKVYLNYVEVPKDTISDVAFARIGFTILDNDNNVFYIGNFYNSTNSTASTTQYQLENFQIYNKLLNVQLEQNKINYSLTPIYYYYDNPTYKIKYPFTFLNLNFNSITNNYLGITNNISDVVNYYQNLNYNKSISNLNFFNIKNGFYIFIVPTSGYYNFVLAGARGGFSSTNKTISGNGIISYFNFYLEVNTILYIGTGFKGGDGGNLIELFLNNESIGFYNVCGGGGGLSFVYDFTNKRLLNIAGGGGGNGINYYGSDALITTSGGKNSINLIIGLEAINGNGGNRGVYGIASGYGAGGGGFLTDGVISDNFNGISLLSIINTNNKLNLPSYNYGGLGGFPCGATGGVNLNINTKVWGGGGGGGYSGGMGGSSDKNNFISGGGGGGSYDITGINNEITLINSLGLNGYNNSNGYVNIKLLTKDNYLSYTGSTINVKNGLVLLHEINNSYCFNYNKLSYYLINQIDGSTSKIVNSFNKNDLSSIITFYIEVKSDLSTSTSYLQINNLRLNLKSISILYKLNTNNLNVNIISNIASYEYFLNDIENPNITTLFNADSISWKFLTIKSNNLTDNIITLFKNITEINIKTIIGYNRIITFNEHKINYIKYNI